MAISKSAIITAVKARYDTFDWPNKTQSEKRDETIGAMVDCIVDEIVSSGVVTVSSGIPLSVDPSTHIGTTTGTGTGTIS